MSALHTTKTALLGGEHQKEGHDESHVLLFGGPDRIRTDDPHNANVMRSQLRYRPILCRVNCE